LSGASQVLLIVHKQVGAFLHSAVYFLTDNTTSQYRGCVPVFSAIFRNGLLCVGEPCQAITSQKYRVQGVKLLLTLV